MNNKASEDKPIGRRGVTKMPGHMPAFMFATGIENSVPTLDGGRVRVDEMEKCGHYTHWRTDFDLVEEMGIHFLRYGPPLHRTFLGVEHYDWSFADETFNDLHQRDLV